MGEDKGSRETFKSATKERTEPGKTATHKAEQKARETGTLNPLVDPKEYGVIRLSLPRFEQQANGLWMMTVGTPVSIEGILDTTSSMGNNVDIALRVLPDTYEMCEAVLPGYDIQMATGIFGDIDDRFVLCRPQFEMVADKIVEQFTYLVPERKGGDLPEDPHYGLFGAAYLTAAYINRIELKGYYFLITDAEARDRLSSTQLRRIFGDQVFEKTKENGHQINENSLPFTEEVFQDLLKLSHAFILQIGARSQAYDFWRRVAGPKRHVLLPKTELLPYVQAAIIGLTEGTLTLMQVENFLRDHQVSAADAREIARSVANIPIGAQAALPNFEKRPQKGDLFKNKTDLWPIGKAESTGEKPNDNIIWL